MKRIFAIALITSQLLMNVNLVIAQEAARQKAFVINDFSGGIATKVSDEQTPTKFARVAENVRLNTLMKAITKRPQIYTYGTADASEFITGIHRLYLSSGTKKLIVTHGDEVEVGNDTSGAFTSILALTTADYRWQFLTWHDLAIGGDGYNQPIKTDGTKATYLGTCFCEDAGSGAGPNGLYKYKVSFYTTSYEVLFNVVSNSVTVTDNDINLSMIPIGPDTYLGETVTGRKVYRTEASGSTYKLLTNGTIANNTATTLTDSDADAALGGAYPAGTATWTPPKGKLCLIHKNRLFIANNPNNPSRIYYSKDGSHDLFETDTDYFDIRANDGDEITFIKNLLGILRVGKTNSIQSLYTNGDDPSTDWEISDPFSTIGCDAMYSAINTPIGIMYLSRSKSGLYVFNGQASILKSEQVIPIIEDISPSNLNSVWGEYNNNVYYMAYPSNAVGGATNNRVLVYDLLSGSFTVDTSSIGCFCSFSSGGDGGILYGGSSINGKVLQFASASKSVIHNKASDFVGTFTDSRVVPVESGGDVNSPVLELAWACTNTGWLADLQGRDGSINTNDDIVVHMHTATNIMPDGGGTYISQVLDTPGAATYDKIAWNETLPSGTDATFAIRGGATASACVAASFSSEYTLASGSDISALSAYPYTQYRITLSSASTSVTPQVTTAGGFTTRLTYNTIGTASESAISLHWQTGYFDLGLPGYIKTLRKIYVSHEGSLGTLTITFTNELGETDDFDIDLSLYKKHYEDYFTNGGFLGRYFKIDIENSDLNDLKIKEIVLIYDVEPMV